jgi:hypothetical protein
MNRTAALVRYSIAGNFLGLPAITVKVMLMGRHLQLPAIPCSSAEIRPAERSVEKI